ncbi:MAG TPA: molybdenum cofactor biosynthesis protein MoaE [Longimicrobiales bacterium]|nr:molybdenum cofactor biosynthesis protein MoaE [Longimicrobiales bacterium]
MYAAITRTPINAQALLDRVRNRSNGAALLFIGTVRDHNDGREVRGLRYDAYEAMAQAELEAIAHEATERLGSDDIAIEHRVGELDVSDIAVAIAVGAAHRATAYEVSRFIIEEIKRRVPIWKEERYVDGEDRWLEGTVPPARAPIR